MGLSVRSENDGIRIIADLLGYFNLLGLLYLNCLFCLLITHEAELVEEIRVELVIVSGLPLWVDTPRSIVADAVSGVLEYSADEALDRQKQDFHDQALAVVFPEGGRRQ